MNMKKEKDLVVAEVIAEYETMSVEDLVQEFKLQYGREPGSALLIVFEFVLLVAKKAYKRGFDVGRASLDTEEG